MKIGVLDSGIGGLTVLKKLLKNFPNHEYIYYGDTLHLPYGNKERTELIGYANKIINFFEEEKVNLIIIACGTLSSNIEYVKSKIKIIDILSPIQNKLDKYHKVSIMATPLSIKVNAFKKYINTEINLISCPLLVPLIENNETNNLDIVLKDYLESTKDSDALLLGCTHYPIIKENIQKYFTKDIICLDDFIIDKLKNLKEGNPSLKIYFSLINETIKNNTERILKEVYQKKIKIERRVL